VQQQQAARIAIERRGLRVPRTLFAKISARGVFQGVEPNAAAAESVGLAVES